jgi:glutathione S-transferase
VLEQHLSRSRFMVGEQFTVADIAIYAYVHCAPEGGFDLAGFPAIRAWLDQVSRRPRHISIERLPDTPTDRT